MSIRFYANSASRSTITPPSKGRAIQKKLALKEHKDQLHIPAGAFVVKVKNNSDALMISIPNSKSNTGEDKLVATVKKGIA